MKQRRSDCPLSSWLEIFGDKWTLLILRDIALFKKKNFKDFISSEEKIASNILAARLKFMVKEGLLTKTQNPNNKLIVDYSITEKGKDILPIANAIATWSNKYIKGTYTIEDLKKVLS